MVKLQKGEYQSAWSDFEEANKDEVKVDGLIGAMVAGNLIKEKRGEATAVWE